MANTKKKKNCHIPHTTKTLMPHTHSVHISLMHIQAHLSSIRGTRQKTCYKTFCL